MSTLSLLTPASRIVSSPIEISVVLPPSRVISTWLLKFAAVMPSAETSNKSCPPDGLEFERQDAVEAEIVLEHEDVGSRAAIHRIVASAAVEDVIALKAQEGVHAVAASRADCRGRCRFRGSCRFR